MMRATRPYLYNSIRDHKNEVFNLKENTMKSAFIEFTVQTNSGLVIGMTKKIDVSLGDFIPTSGLKQNPKDSGAI